MNTSDLLKASQEEIFKAVAGISDDDAESLPVEKNWTVRDLIGNLCAYEQVLEDIFSAQMVQGSSAPFLYQLRTMKPHEFDAYHYEEYRKIRYAELLADLTVRHNHLISMMWQMTDDRLDEKGTIPWHSEQATIREYILNTHHPRKLAVAEKITKFKKHLEILHNKPSKKTDQ